MRGTRPQPRRAPRAEAPLRRRARVRGALRGARLQRPMRARPRAPAPPQARTPAAPPRPAPVVVFERYTCNVSYIPSRRRRLSRCMPRLRARRRRPRARPGGEARGGGRGRCAGWDAKGCLCECSTKDCSARYAPRGGRGARARLATLRHATAQTFNGSTLVQVRFDGPLSRGPLSRGPHPRAGLGTRLRRVARVPGAVLGTQVPAPVLTIAEGQAHAPRVQERQDDPAPPRLPLTLP